MFRKPCLIALLAALAACDSGTIDPIVPADSIRALTIDEQQVVSASNTFAFDLLREANAAETAKPNLMVSPLSASMALGMALNGAAGSTFTAMRGTLGFGTQAESQINAAYAGLIRQLYARAGTRVQFALANAVWYDTGFPVYASFTDTLEHYFDAEVRQLDFASATAPQTISQWAEQKTGGRIKNLLDRIDDNEVLFLVNAVYFKAPWSKAF
ncbi:MAG TPA: serpin family protein, partial [Longimicrobiales bacterium]